MKRDGHNHYTVTQRSRKAILQDGSSVKKEFYTVMEDKSGKRQEMWQDSFFICQVFLYRAPYEWDRIQTKYRTWAKSQNRTATLSDSPRTWTHNFPVTVLTTELPLPIWNQFKCSRSLSSLDLWLSPQCHLVTDDLLAFFLAWCF